MAKVQKKSCIMYGEWLELLKDEDLSLSDAEIGIVMIAVLEYIQTGEMPKFSDRGLMAVFKSIKGQIDKDGEKYDETCKKRRESSAKRWSKCTEDNAKNANACKCTEDNANVYDNECDNDNEHNSLSESMCVNAHARESKESEPKTAYGFFRNVFLSDEEKCELEAKYGEDKLKKAILKLDARIQKDGKYKGDNHAGVIVQWVIEAVEEDEVRALEREGRKKKARGSPDKVEKAKKAGFDFEFEDIYEKP